MSGGAKMAFLFLGAFALSIWATSFVDFSIQETEVRHDLCD